jgi:hypothetical protein
VPGHADAIKFILRLDAAWENLSTAIIAEADDAWIVNGRIIKKEVT